MTNLICLCASHIDAKNRFISLQNMIESWNKQKAKINMFISISSNKELKNQIIEYLDKFESLTYYYSDEQLKQFQHYKLLCQKLYRNYRNHWVIFTDDDDEWSIYRSSEYFNLIDQLENYDDRENVLYLRLHGTFDQKKGEYIKNENTQNMGNYIEYSTKLSILKKFTDEANNVLLNHSYCDMYFLKFIRLRNNLKTIHSISEIPLYYYNYNQESVTSNIQKTAKLNDKILNNLLLYFSKSDRFNLKEAVKFLNINSNRNMGILNKRVKEIYKINNLQYFEKSPVYKND